MALEDVQNYAEVRRRGAACSDSTDWEGEGRDAWVGVFLKWACLLNSIR